MGFDTIEINLVFLFTMCAKQTDWERLWHNIDKQSQGKNCGSCPGHKTAMRPDRRYIMIWAGIPGYGGKELERRINNIEEEWIMACIHCNDKGGGRPQQKMIMYYMNISTQLIF